MSLASLLNQSIKLYTKSSKNKFGRETYGTGTSYLARVQKKTITRVLPTQETVTIEAIIYVKPTITIEKGDKLTYGADDYRVYAVYDAVDGDGNVNHRKVEVEKWA